MLHGGICFYGGGKNYSEVIVNNQDLLQFNVNLSILAKGLTDSESNEDDVYAFQQGTFLPYAAGSEDFRFMMYTSNGNHSYSNVQDMIQNEVVNDIVYKNPANPASYVSK